MKCEVCGDSNTKENPVSKDSDPYKEDVNNDNTEVWECKECRKKSAANI